MSKIFWNSFHDSDYVDYTEYLEDRLLSMVATSDIAKVALNSRTSLNAPADWQPKAGERVLVEATSLGNNVIQTTLRGKTYDYYVDRSAIVGPAPARARFATGDVVVHRHKLCVGVITREEDDQHYYTVEFDGIKWDIIEDNLLTFDEARERLK